MSKYLMNKLIHLVNMNEVGGEINTRQIRACSSRNGKRHRS